MEKNIFDQIFFDHSESGFVTLAFIDTKTNQGLYFDTNTFYYRDFSKYPVSNMNKLKYSPCTEIIPFYIVEVKGAFDVCYIKMINGDIFQIHFMDDGSKYQALFIIGEESKSIMTPLGINSYEAAARRLLEEEDPEILVWENISS